MEEITTTPEEISEVLIHARRKTGRCNHGAH